MKLYFLSHTPTHSYVVATSSFDNLIKFYIQHFYDHELWEYEIFLIFLLWDNETVRWSILSLNREENSTDKLRFSFISVRQLIFFFCVVNIDFHWKIFLQRFKSELLFPSGQIYFCSKDETKKNTLVIWPTTSLNDFGMVWLYDWLFFFWFERVNRLIDVDKTRQMGQTR